MTPTLAILVDPARRAGLRCARVYVTADFSALRGAAVVERTALQFLGTLNPAGQHVVPYSRLAPRAVALGRKLRTALSRGGAQAENPPSPMAGAPGAAA